MLLSDATTSVPDGAIVDCCDMDLAGGNSNTNRQLIPMAPKGFLTPINPPLPYRLGTAPECADFLHRPGDREGHTILGSGEPANAGYDRELHEIMKQRLESLFSEGGCSSFADLSLVAVEPIPEEIFVSPSPFAPTVPSSFHEHSHQSEQNQAQ